MKGVQLRGKTYRDIVVGHYGLEVCDSHIGCRASFSRLAHINGRSDANRIVHSSRLDRRASKQRLGPVLVVVGGILLGHHDRHLPLWQKIYEANTWAMKEAKFVWGVQLSAQSQMKARKKVLHLARITCVRLRYHHAAVYQWARIARSGVTNGTKTTREIGLGSNARETL